MSEAHRTALTMPAQVAVLPPANATTFSLVVRGEPRHPAADEPPSYSASGGVDFSTGSHHQALDLRLGAAGDDMTVGPDLRVPGTCDEVTQIGCGSGKKCTEDLVNQQLVCATNGAQIVGGGCGQPGSNALADDNCTRGGVCLPEGAFNLCRQFCHIDADCSQSPVIQAGNTGHCIYVLTLDLKVCSYACDPVTPDDVNIGGGCPQGQTCRLLARLAGLSQLTDCRTNSFGTDGTACDPTAHDVACSPGLGCHPDAKRCRKVCRITDDCARFPGTTCQFPSDAQLYGYCCGSGC
jgi:hypothetical protein